MSDVFYLVCLVFVCVCVGVLGGAWVKECWGRARGGYDDDEQ